MQEVVCKSCGNTRVVASDRGRDCRDCGYKKQASKLRKKEPMMHTWTCSKCGIEKKFKAIFKNPDTYICRSCYGMDVSANPKPRKKYDRTNLKSIKDRRSKVVENAIKKEQDRNKAFRERLEKEKKKVIPLLTIEQERAMIEAYYNENEVIHIDCKEEYGQSTLTRMIVNGST